MGKNVSKRTWFIALAFITGSIAVFFWARSFTTTPTFFEQPRTSETISIPKRSAPSIVYGYLPYWTRSSAHFPNNLTHVSYFSLGIQSDGKLLDIPKADQESGYRGYQNGALAAIKKQLRPSQKLELTLTMMDQEAIPVFLRNETARAAFIKDLERIVGTKMLSGINIDIEYNGLVDEALQADLTSLIQDTRTLLTKQDPPLSLSIATYSDAGDLQRVTNLKTLAPYVDHVIMMAYDFHRSKSPNAGPNSPIYGKSTNRWSEDIMSDLQKYLQSVPPEKIVLGVPFYGYAWSVEDANNPNAFTLPKTGESVPYKNILEILKRPGLERHWDSDALSPYLRYTANGQTKILYYDDEDSLRYKRTLVNQAGLGGVAIWALGYEDDSKTLWDALTLP